ncbi:zf-HC2 domain-containing protein [Yinghuangia soli]|uniref:Zf-HC2 domain-containing protein n=1 Tax=Yinghuangia soli TaxID=2908204 RepID=A0AA41U157_9ACTN|nr:zf-HC2 domain-containing protein [Yinghuangia soli]MCF2525794.1 zf-HC2 domain-containing protein [Yinghuangia soli]
MSRPVEHTDVGAYALGLLEGGDKVVFEAHLAGCERCRRDLREFGEMGPLRRLLADVHPDAFLPVPRSPAPVLGWDRRPEPPFAVPNAPVAEPRPLPGGAAVHDLGAARRARDARERRGVRRASRALAAVAASAVLIVAGVAIGGGFEGSQGHGPSADLMLTGERHPATGTVRGVGEVTAAVALETRGWGSHVGIELRGVYGPLTCNLVVVGKDGRREVVGNWTVPEKGYGVPANPAPLVFHGGTSIPRERIDRFEVDTSDGRVLVTVPM